MPLKDASRRNNINDRLRIPTLCTNKRKDERVTDVAFSDFHPERGEEDGSRETLGRRRKTNERGTYWVRSGMMALGTEPDNGLNAGRVVVVRREHGISQRGVERRLGGGRKRSLVHIGMGREEC
jgi:hypothetical protein